jgi:hypothetical protein
VSFRGKKSAIARLVFIAVYAIAFVAAGFGHWSQPVFIAEYIGTAVLWLVLMSYFVVDLTQSGQGWRYVRSCPAIPLLLISPVFLFLDWDVVWFATIIVAYIFELRRHAAGDAFTFSFALIAFVGVVAALTMVELENDNPESQFRGPSDAIYWAFGGLLRINIGGSYNPATEDGRWLATTVAICGIIAASMFTARMVSWIVGTQQTRGAAGRTEAAAAEGDEVTALRAEVEQLKARLATHEPSPGVAP